ncbi:Uncharacterised protein [Vibrio cholerae]|nr:Uncharacterised protein [Vibrio cholerae]
MFVFCDFSGESKHLAPMAKLLFFYRKIKGCFSVGACDCSQIRHMRPLR